MQARERWLVMNKSSIASRWERRIQACEKQLGVNQRKSAAQTRVNEESQVDGTIKPTKQILGHQPIKFSNAMQLIQELPPYHLSVSATKVHHYLLSGPYSI